MPRKLPYIKPVRRRGKLYEYFITGAKVDGKPVLKRLPPRSDVHAFGQAYAGFLAHRTQRQNVESIPTLRDVSKRYQLSDKYRKRAVSTQSTYLIYLTQLEEAMGDAGIDEIERRDVQALMDKMADRPGAAAMALLVLRNLFKFSIKREWIKTDPSAGVEPPEGKDEEYEPWPEPLLEEALETSDDSIRLPVALLYYTAQRIGDVCKMRWSDIRDGHIHVRQQKTGKDLAFPIHADLAKALARIPRDTMTILHGPKGRPARAATLRAQLKAWADKRGEAIVPHGIRKNAVNALLECGCSIAEVSSISGQTLELVEHYAKRRNNRRIGGAAILKWERGTKREDRKQVENK